MLVTLRSSGWLEIEEPDVDGDDQIETLVVSDARGVELTLGRSGGRRAWWAEREAEDLVFEADDGTLGAFEVRRQR